MDWTLAQAKFREWEAGLGFCVMSPAKRKHGQLVAGMDRWTFAIPKTDEAEMVAREMKRPK